MVCGDKALSHCCDKPMADNASSYRGLCRPFHVQTFYNMCWILTQKSNKKKGGKGQTNRKSKKWLGLPKVPPPTICGQNDLMNDQVEWLKVIISNIFFWPNKVKTVHIFCCIIVESIKSKQKWPAPNRLLANPPVASESLP